ncbi:MAG: WXG100 family type VII secretion target [Lachnospiraceae bacterium]|nr:WXG100 family type VII secretion target [Lachnospiraceae bacterium]
MSMFQVTASEMQSAISQLQSDNQEFMARVQELSENQQELAAMWTGDANTAFNNAFQTDATKWTEFYNLINQYIEALNSILTIYTNAESANTETAVNRTY